MWDKIKTFTRNTVVSLMLLSVVAVIGCRAVVDSLTPAEINQRAKDYSKVEPEVIGDWESLNDAKKVRTEIVINHRDEQIDLKRMAQDDKIKYQDALGFIDANIENATALQELMIGSAENPISILGMLAPMGLGTLAGAVLIKRGKDYSPEQYEAGVAKAKTEK